MPFRISRMASSRTSPTVWSFCGKLWVILGAIYRTIIFFLDFLDSCFPSFLTFFLPVFQQIIKNFLTSIIALAKNAIRNIESGVFEDKPNLHRVELVDNEINHLKLSALSVGRVSPKGTVFCGFVLTSVSLLHIVSFSRIYQFFKIRYWSFFIQLCSPLEYTS